MLTQSYVATWRRLAITSADTGCNYVEGDSVYMLQSHWRHAIDVSAVTDWKWNVKITRMTAWVVTGDHEA